MGKFTELFNNYVMVGLVMMSILAFGIFFQAENNSPNQFAQNDLINETFNTLVEDLGGLRDQSQTQKDLFESENPTVGFGTILLFSIVSSGKIFNSMMVGIFNTLIKLPVVILGLDPAVVAVISTLMIFAIIMGLWIVYKLGG